MYAHKLADIQNTCTSKFPRGVDGTDDYDLRATLRETVVTKASYGEFWHALQRFREQCKGNGSRIKGAGLRIKEAGLKLNPS